MPQTKRNKQVLVGVVIALVFWAISSVLKPPRDFETGFYGGDNTENNSLYSGNTDSGWINRNQGGTVGGDGQCTYYNSSDGGSVMTGC